MGLDGAFIVRENKPGFREFSGTIENISEGGIKISINEEEYADITEQIEIGTKVLFQSFDEYVIYHEKKVDVFGGEAVVVRVEEADGRRMYGCSFTALQKELADYISNKKLSLFLGNDCAWN